MALFRFLKPEKPVPFTYHPRFYDEKKEAFQERLKKAQELAGNDPEALKGRIRRDLQRRSSYLADRNYRTKRVMQSNMLLLVVIVALIILTFVAIEVYLPRIVQYLE
ncbi:MAG: hypothetical protein R2830_01775 [Saprospiraceae bacterium]